ncbi:40S ribosomal protein [Kappamyces sp. JEL0680]|nr:40S ribosomal protein [Kappamyces sp. JEL0680]
MSARNKILKPAGVQPDELELQVAQHIYDLEQNAELKADLRGLQITAAKEVQVRLVRELEKKFSDRHVLFIAQRRILARPSHKSRVQQKRPRSRTLTSVHESILEDLVFPTEIVGKRTKVKVDGSKTIKVFLDRKDHTSLEYKLDTFSATYKKLTGKEVVFEFPVAADN